MIDTLIRSADWKAEKHVPVITLLSPFKPGTLHALAYCNLHGLWESESAVAGV